MGGLIRLVAIVCALPGAMMTDGAGRQVRVPRPAATIVSLAPSVTEILFAVGAGDRVAGVTDFCDYPAAARTLPRVGGLINPDLERIVSLKPDLAIASTSGNYLDDAERIERLGIPVYTLHTPDIASMLEAILKVGELAGREEAARTLGSRLRGRIDRVRERTAGLARPGVLFVIEPAPLIAPGPGSFMAEALAAAGARPAVIEGTPRWAQLDMEQLLALAPDVILTAPPNRSWAESLKANPEWRRVPAVAAGRVRVVSDAIQHPGPRLVDGIEEVEALLRPLRKPGP